MNQLVFKEGIKGHIQSRTVETKQNDPIAKKSRHRDCFLNKTDRQNHFSMKLLSENYSISSRLPKQEGHERCWFSESTIFQRKNESYE